VEIRRDDTRVERFVTPIDDRDAAASLLAERAVVRRLGGGCQMPIGAYAAQADGTLDLSAVVISLDGARAVRAEASGPADAAEALGRTVADRLLAEGAGEILADVERAQGAVEGIQP
jgi:hydroxymethylbilane synthase